MGYEKVAVRIFNIRTQKWTVPNACQNRTNIYLQYFMLKFSHISASDEESSEADTQTTQSIDSATDDDIFDLELASNINTFVPWDDFNDLDISSRSDDCLDELLPDMGTPKQSRDQATEPPVVLIMRKELSEEDSLKRGSAFGHDLGKPHGLESDLDPDPGCDRDEVKYKKERGFYDVGMLTVDVMSLSTEALTKTLDERGDLNYLLHPDIKIELLMAEQKKHIRIAQLLKLSQPPPEPLSPLQIICPPSTTENQDRKEGTLVPPNTPKLAKLKPDACWIKDIPDSPEVMPTADTPPVPTEGAAVPSSETISPAGVTEPCTQNPVEEQDSSKQEPKTQAVHRNSTSSATKTHDLASRSNDDISRSRDSLSRSHEKTDSDSCSNIEDHNVNCSICDTVSESGSDQSKNDLHHYVKEDIPWNPGTVKRHKQVMEEKIKYEQSLSPKGERVRHTSVSSHGSQGGSVVDSNEDLYEAVTLDTTACIAMESITESLPTMAPEFSIEGASGSGSAQTAQHRPMINVIEPTPERELSDKPQTSGESTKPQTSEESSKPTGKPSQTNEVESKTEDVDQESSKDSESRDPSNGKDRRSFIYESEQIELEPGIVQRTKQEIELRERCVLKQYFFYGLKCLKKTHK